MKEFFFLNDCSSYGSHWLWCIVFLKKSGVQKNGFFDTSGNLEEDITKLNNKLKMKNTKFLGIKIGMYLVSGLETEETGVFSCWYAVES